MLNPAPPKAPKTRRIAQKSDRGGPEKGSKRGGLGRKQSGEGRFRGDLRSGGTGDIWAIK